MPYISPILRVNCIQITAQNTRTEEEKPRNAALKVAIGRTNLRNTFENPQTKPNRLMLTVFHKFPSLITTLKAAVFLIQLTHIL